MEINICIPTLNSYSTLWKCVESINNSDVKVSKIYIIDNGGGLQHNGQDNLYINKVPQNIGVAASWNHFIREVPEFRIICNDDITFSPDTIRIMVEKYEPNGLVFPTEMGSGNAFSCFLLSQNVIDHVGLFDEWISPNYAYFEDNDYAYRMSLMGFRLYKCDANIVHIGSSTLKNYNRASKDAHHKKFRLAEGHYIQKWGGAPGHETFTTPFGA